MRFRLVPALLLITFLVGEGTSVVVAQTAQPKTSSPPASAATPAGSKPDPKKTPLIEELFRITKPELVVNNLLQNYKSAFSQAASQGYEQEVKKFDDPAKYRADFNKLQDRVFALLSSRMDWAKMKPQFVQSYSDAFTVDELSGMVTFYKSPAGKAFLEKTPGLMQRLNIIGQQQVGNIGPEVQKMMSDFMADLKKRSAASSPKPPAK